MSWIEKLLGIGATHYTCTSNRKLEATPGSSREHISYDVLIPKVRERLGRDPIDPIELSIVAEQIIRDTKRK